MTIASEVRRAGPYAGNGSTQVFAFSFKTFSQNDLAVVSTTAGVDTVLTLTTHYTVSLNGDQDGSPGGTVTILTAPAVGTSISILSDRSLLQALNVQNAGAFLPANVNNALDNIVIGLQQVSDQQARGVRGALSDPEWNRLPTAAERAGGLLGFDGSGQPIVADIEGVEAIATDIATVAGISSEIQIVAAADVDIGSVADNIASVIAVAGAIGGGIIDTISALVKNEYENVSELLNDVALTYTLGQTGTVAAADVVRTRAEDFKYEVAPSAAADFHLETAGGVKLYILPDADGRRAINALGPANDGSTDDASIFSKVLTIGGAWVGSGEYFTGSAQTGVVEVQIYGNCIIKHAKSAGALILSPSPGSDVSVSSIGADVQYPAISTQLSTPITVASTVGLSRGQVCLLKSTDVYGYGNGVEKSELIRILEIVGSVVYTHGVIEDVYTTGIKLIPLSDANIIVDGPTFTVSEDVYVASTPFGYVASLTLVGCLNPRVDVKVTNGLGAGIATVSCWAPDIRCDARNMRDKLSDNALGYGVVNYAATKFGQYSIRAERVRHAYTDGDYGTLGDFWSGVPRRNTVRGVAIACTAAAWDTHAEGHDTLFEHCEAYAGNGDADSTANLKYAFQVRGRNVTLVNPRVRGLNGIFVSFSETLGEENECLVYNPDIEVGGAASETTFALWPVTSSDVCRFKVYGGRMRGSPVIGANAPVTEIYETVMEENNTFRIGQNNSVTLIGMKRISEGAIGEGIQVDAGSTLTIDEHFVQSKTASIGNSKIILTGPTAGTATVRLGKITEDVATGGSLTFVSQETATLSLQPLPTAMSSLVVGNGAAPAVSGRINVTSRYEVNGTQVVGARGALIADAAGGATVDAECRAATNEILARLRAHGLIAT